MKYISKILMPVFLLPVLLIADSEKKLVPIGPPINTRYSDFAPSFTSDGKTMVFNSKRGKRYQDLYISYYKGGRWTIPENLITLNSRYNDETPFITPDGKVIFFSSDRDGSLAMTRDQHGRVRISYDLYMAGFINGRWTIPEKVPGRVNTVNHERAPCMSPDKRTLFYTSWPFGLVKHSRIMKAELQNGAFINIQQLPSPVNTNNQEMAFVSAFDKSGFYFSSRRPGGFGGWDIYFVSYKNGAFGKPVNLGKRINSTRNELYFYKIGERVFICSDRPGGQGKYDIYTLDKKNIIKFLVRNKKTGKSLSVISRLSAETKDPKTGRSKRAQINKKSDKKGRFSVEVHPSIDEIEIIINREGFLPFFKKIDPEKAEKELQILELIPLEKEASFDINAIYFDFNSARIKPVSYRFLDAFAKYLKKNSKLRFLIIGHTDMRGSDTFNMDLSLKRARAVKNYLVKKGLKQGRFEVKGAGKSRPRVNKTGPGFDEQNRRTEFKLID